jgi:hypothetical protein
MICLGGMPLDSSCCWVNVDCFFGCFFVEEFSGFDAGVIEVVRRVVFLFDVFVSVFEFEFEFDLGLIISFDSLLVSLRFTLIFIFCLNVLICIDDENDNLFFLFKLLQLAVFVIVALVLVDIVLWCLMFVVLEFVKELLRPLLLFVMKLLFEFVMVKQF